MKQTSRTRSLILLLITGWFASLPLSAQPQPVILRLKGIAVGGNLSDGASDMRVVGNFAYLAWSGLQIFSLSNSTAPTWVGGCGSVAHPNSVCVLGHYAYLALGTTRTFTNDPGAFEIIDVSNPTNPVCIGGMDTRGRANAIHVTGNYAYVAESTRWTGSNLLGALEIFNVSIPTMPIRVATFDTAGSATSVDISGDHAYLADGVTDLQVLDVSDPGHPRRVGEYLSDISRNDCGFEPGGPANFVQVVDNVAYSSGENGLHVLDISDPSHPTSIGNNFCFAIQSFGVFGPHAFATIWLSHANTYYLRVLDTSEPANLVVVGSKLNWNSPVFQVVGNLVYLATNPLSVYEISHNPAITSLSVDTESLVLTWDFAPGFLLQRTTSLGDGVWNDVPDSDGQEGIQLPTTNSIGFFRLARPQPN